MNKQMRYLFAGATAVALIFGMLLGGALKNSSADAQNSSNDDANTESAEQSSTWTCSMHPQIQQQEPGDCPICGMDLIPLEKDDGADEGSRVMSMSKASRALAEIQTTTVIKDYPEAEIRLVGKLGYDETREKSLAARFPARIDELYVNYTGIRVKQGEHLAEVYSPELLTAQRELITAYRASPDSSITRIAREKLRLWGLLPEQIEAIIARGEPQDHFVLKAPIGGVVVSKQVKEGEYIETGELLFKLVDLSVLWADLDAYESELPWLRYGQEVTFTVESFPGETFNGQIAFIEPEVDRKTRTVPVRVNVSNEDQRLKPGMFVRAVVRSRLSENGKVYAPEFEGKWISPMHPEIVKDAPGQCDVCGMDLVPAEELGYVENSENPPPLIIPASAVLRTGKRSVVYVENPDAERPTYEGREIVLGPRAGDDFIVTSGLAIGERVVTNGAFKIDSALQIQAKPSMMNPGEELAAPVHQHGDISDDKDAHAEHAQAETFLISNHDAHEILPLYLTLQKALADDDLPTSKDTLKTMMSVVGHTGALPDLLHTMSSASTLDELRKPHFETLSNALIVALKDSAGTLEDELYIMHCPMVYGDSGADWLQDSDQLRNPYFGAMMLKCGDLKETIITSENKHSSH